MRVKSVINKIKDEAQKNTWIVGGGEIITHLINLDVVDEMIIYIMPVVLGSGIPLFPNKPKETWFQLKETKGFDTGVVMMSYSRMEKN